MSGETDGDMLLLRRSGKQMQRESSILQHAAYILETMRAPAKPKRKRSKANCLEESSDQTCKWSVIDIVSRVSKCNEYRGQLQKAALTLATSLESLASNDNVEIEATVATLVRLMRSPELIDSSTLRGDDGTGLSLQTPPPAWMSDLERLEAREKELESMTADMNARVALIEARTLERGVVTSTNASPSPDLPPEVAPVMMASSAHSTELIKEPPIAPEIQIPEAASVAETEGKGKSEGKEPPASIDAPETRPGTEPGTEESRTLEDVSTAEDFSEESAMVNKAIQELLERSDKQLGPVILRINALADKWDDAGRGRKDFEIVRHNIHRFRKRWFAFQEDSRKLHGMKNASETIDMLWGDMDHRHAPMSRQTSPSASEVTDVLRGDTDHRHPPMSRQTSPSATEQNDMLRGDTDHRHPPMSKRPSPSDPSTMRNEWRENAALKQKLLMMEEQNAQYEKTLKIFQSHLDLSVKFQVELIDNYERRFLIK